MTLEEFEQLTPTAKKAYKAMALDTDYKMSGIGYLVFGRLKKDTEHLSFKCYLRPQGAARAIGRFVSELHENGLVTYTESCMYQKVKLNRAKARK